MIQCNTGTQHYRRWGKRKIYISYKYSYFGESSSSPSSLRGHCTPPLLLLLLLLRIKVPPPPHTIGGDDDWRSRVKVASVIGGERGAGIAAQVGGG